MTGSLEIHEPNDRTWQIGEDRLRILAELAALERPGAALVDAAARDLGINRSHCYNLLRRYRKNPTITALLPRARGRSTGLRQLDVSVEALVENAINGFYLTRAAPSVAALVREIQRCCFEKSATPPTRKAVESRIRALDQFEVLKRRKGASYARSKLGRIKGHLSEDEPLGRVQIDHTLADVIVVAESDRHPLRRPWLTLAIDVATRMVAGFYLSLEAPSSLSVAMVLSQAVLPKERYLESRGVDVSWPVSGLPQRLHLDNAREFRSKALARGVAQYGIEVQYRPPATPHWGGHIERLIGTMMGALRMLPGATGPSVAERADDPEGKAIMTMDELEIWLAYQIAGIYHYAEHRSLGTTPIDAWVGAVAQLQNPHRQPPDTERFYLDFLPFKQRRISRSGISMFGITYSDGVVSTFLAQPKQLFVVRYDPRDLSRVFLRDLDGTYWPIPYSDRRLPAVTLSEVKAASRRLRAAGEKSVGQQQLFVSMEEQRKLVEQAGSKTKLARREKERTQRALRASPNARRPPHQEVSQTFDNQEEGPVLPFPVEEWL